MSFFSNIVKNVKEFYSEINAATLTGAIDVIVIQGQDGTYRCSPFHVRFGKLGVLKAREKIVDLEINGEPVSIQMKLDDNGVAFFVGEVEDEENWNPNLATSPIPSNSSWEFREIDRQDGKGDSKPMVTSSPSIQHPEAAEAGAEDERDDGRKGKLNKKKRRRRNMLKHGRKGSKTSLKEITADSEQDMFHMEDVNDADQEEEEDDPNEEQWSGGGTPAEQWISGGTPAEEWIQAALPVQEEWSKSCGEQNSSKQIANMHRNLSLDFAKSFNFSSNLSTPNISTGGSTPLSTPMAELDPLGTSAPVTQFPNLYEELTVENSLIGSRVPLIPKSRSEAKTLEAILNGKETVDEEARRPKSVSASFHYFSDTEVDRQSTPLAHRPDSPVTSDSEIEKNSSREDQPSWKWGELPSPLQTVTHQVSDAETSREMAKERSLLGWFRTNRRLQEVELEEKGMYLDDLISGQIDPQTAAIYLSPSLVYHTDTLDAQSQKDPLDLEVPADPSADESILPDIVVSDDLEDSIVEDIAAAVDQADSTTVEVAVDIPTATTVFDSKIIKTEVLEISQNETVFEDASMSVTTETAADPVNPVPARRLCMDTMRDDDCESGHGPSLPMSPQSGLITQGVRIRSFNSDSEDDLPAVITRHIPDLAMSLCGGLTGDRKITPSVFMAKYITRTDFVSRLREDKEFLANPNLVVRINEKYTSWSAAAPLLLSILLFKEPLPADLSAELTKGGMSVNVSLGAKEEMEKRERKVSSWFTWFGSSSTSPQVKLLENTEEPVKTEDAKEPLPASVKLEAAAPAEAAAKLPVETREAQEVSSSDGEADSRKCRKTLRLTSEKLKEMNLRPGSNEIQFSVTTAFQGTTRCKCHIYLWKHSDKVVISDIDGTITKSDVLGHILPVIGRDWAQSGVAQLFTKIRNNGYHIMYLSARAIGQASITKDYLQSVKQGDLCLPDGPLFLNPESLIHAFRKEVIDRNPEEFKIRCLKDIQSLFPGRNPFFAGYGNRPNDAYAYRAVGIPISRIFTINPAGELRHELTQNFQTSYATQSLEIEEYFPNFQRTVDNIKCRKQSHYFETADSLEKVRNKSESQEEWTFANEDSRLFRVRSGTDISNSLLSHRHKFRRAHSTTEDDQSIPRALCEKLKEAHAMVSLVQIADIELDLTEETEDMLRMRPVERDRSEAVLSDEDVFDDCTSRKVSSSNPEDAPERHTAASMYDII